VQYATKNRSKCLLAYHLIFVVKYRQKLLLQYGEFVKRCVLDIAQDSDFTICEMEVDKDHIHIIVDE